LIHGDVLGERARLTPEKTALVVVASGERRTYRQLDEAAVRCARSWQRLGLARGERVAILAHNRPEYLEAFFAAPKSGHVLVTLGTRLTAHELAHVVRDAGVSALVYDGELADTAAALRELVEVPCWIALDEPAAAGDLSYRELVAAEQADGFTRVPCDPEDLHACSTRGHHRQAQGRDDPAAHGRLERPRHRLRLAAPGDDVSPIFTPLYHAGGLMAFLVPIFVIGGTVVLHRGFDAGEIWRTVEAEGCTVVLGVPTIWKLLMEAPEFRPPPTCRASAG
jgi:fatty-acyl-CoA synthase